MLHPSEVAGFVVNDAVKTNRTYIFNVCKNTSVVPGHFNDEPCNTYTKPYDSIAAWQTERFYRPDNAEDHSWDACVPLGHSDSMSWKLLEESNPSAGVSLTYLGDGRQLTLAFECGDEYGNTFDEEFVAETTPGEYEIVLRTIWGCPTECPISHRSNHMKSKHKSAPNNNF
jgi:hypothetical protein